MSGNPILNGLGNMNPQQMMVQQILQRNPQFRNIFSMLQQGANPQQLMQNMMAQNPQVKQLLNSMQQSGMGAEQYVRNLAKQYNVNIEPMLQSFRNKGYR